MVLTQNADIVLIQLYQPDEFYMLNQRYKPHCMQSSSFWLYGQQTCVYNCSRYHMSPRRAHVGTLGSWVLLLIQNLCSVILWKIEYLSFYNVQSHEWIMGDFQKGLGKHGCRIARSFLLWIWLLLQLAKFRSDNWHRDRQQVRNKEILLAMRLNCPVFPSLVSLRTAYIKQFISNTPFPHAPKDSLPTLLWGLLSHGCHSSLATDCDNCTHLAFIILSSCYQHCQAGLQICDSACSVISFRLDKPGHQRITQGYWCHSVTRFYLLKKKNKENNMPQPTSSSKMRPWFSS